MPHSRSLRLILPRTPKYLFSSLRCSTTFIPTDLTSPLGWGTHPRYYLDQCNHKRLFLTCNSSVKHIWQQDKNLHRGTLKFSCLIWPTSNPSKTQTLLSHWECKSCGCRLVTTCSFTPRGLQPGSWEPGTKTYMKKLHTQREQKSLHHPHERRCSLVLLTACKVRGKRFYLYSLQSCSAVFDACTPP